MNKQKIAILTDSGSDVPKAFAKECGIFILPLNIHYKNETYQDDVNITADEVYSRLTTEIPKTSLPNGETVLAALDQIKEQGYEKVIAICMSSGISGTFNMVRMMALEYEGLEITCIDTKNISIGSGFHVIKAIEYIEKGYDYERIVNNINKSISLSKVYFIVSTLEYLQKGGRIGLVASLLGNALNLKPIISCNEDGVYYVVTKVRGRKHSIHKAMDLIKEYASHYDRYMLAVMNGAAKEEAEQVKQQLDQELTGIDGLIEAQISPGLGVHTGPGLIGIGLYPEIDE